MSDEERRAERRRTTWQGSVAPAGSAATLDLAFWSSAPGEARLEAVWQMAVEFLLMKGEHGPRSGLQGPAAGVRRR